MENEEEEELNTPKKSDDIVHHGHRVNTGDLPVSGLYENWFLEYASYVILERAVPNLFDGLKPVQRRILHVMKEMDDGRFNKVANIIGSAMQYHPHGDAAIGEAIVNLGQKDLMIETQGNWGDIRTGDRAAAPRYIEARLSKFALEVTFNDENTEWQISYDGRKKEPVTLPVKFPLVLAQGVEGIAVGLATKIMPHNFIELCEASIDVLKGKKTNILPDFPTGGLADFSNYNEGRRGGKIRCRARIEAADGKKVLIKDIPFSTTTESVIDSILKANDSGKIKIKKVIDNTAKDVEIEVQLTPGVSTDMTIDALYAFTDCEVSISPNACVINEDRPYFLGVNEMLKSSTENTLHLLKRELENELKHLENKWHFSSLEKIFIENKIYRHIEECESWEEILEMIDSKLKPFKKLLKREVTREDIAKLPEIRIKRISKYDSFKADEYMKGLETQIDEVNNHLANLIEFAIDYFKNLIKKYGKGRERKTEIRMFDKIETNVVAVANEKLYVNYAEGFVGYGLKKDEYICDCSDIDDVIVFRKNGTYLVSKVQEKQFLGKDILYVDVYRKNDERKVYNVAYYDGKSGSSYVKRFNVLGVIRDKEYDVTMGTTGSKMIYFSANNNSEAEKIAIYLSNMASAKNKYLEYDFSTLEIKGRTSKGNTLTKHPIRKIELKEKGKSTFKGREIWYDSDIGRLNVDGRGQLLGTFTSEDKILVIFNDGNYELTDNELTNRYEDKDIYMMQKFHEKQPISCIHYDVSSKNYYAKRFLIETTTTGKKFLFINERPSSKLILASTHENPEVELKTTTAKGEKKTEIIKLGDFIEVKGWKASGNKITSDTFKSAKLLSEKIGEWIEEVVEEVVSEGKVPETIIDELDGQKTLF
ncbi:MAG: DNA gyrase/topoisomerase IV subunit A [Bacteroidota bacterium]|nr:DNA gyrase/topoisomerase IV subunit A [Bacteroidota bacterium]